MTDIVERLRAGSLANAPWEPEYKVPPTSLHLEAADEIERLRKIEESARNLLSVKGRHHTEKAYQRLEEVLK